LTRSKSYKTTKKDFATYKKECEFWIEYFGLKHWEVCYYHADVDNAAGSCRVDLVDGSASILLGTMFYIPVTKREIQLTAFHEVCELMSSHIWVRMEKWYSKPLVQKWIHDIIRRLENTIFKEYRG